MDVMVDTAGNGSNREHGHNHGIGSVRKWNRRQIPFTVEVTVDTTELTV